MGVKIKQQESRADARRRGTQGRLEQKGKARYSNKPSGGKRAR